MMQKVNGESMTGGWLEVPGGTFFICETKV